MSSRTFGILALILFIVAGVLSAAHLLGAPVPSSAGVWPFAIALCFGFVAAILKTRENQDKN